jgi:hypothetical protein
MDSESIYRSEIVAKIQSLKTTDLQMVLAFIESLDQCWLVETTQEDQEQEEQEDSIWTKDYYNEDYNPRKEV